MYIWLGLILFLIVLKLGLGELDTPKKRKRYLIFAGLATALLMSLRGENYGKVYDVMVYKNFFEKIAESSWATVLAEDKFEIGFVILNKLLSMVFPFSQAILIFQGFFCIFCMCRFIYRNTEDVFWGYFFFVTLGTMGFMMTGLRQAIAIGVCLLNVENIKEKKLFRFLLLVFLATTIHRTSLVFIAAYFVCNVPILQKRPGLYVLVIAGVALLAPQLMKIGESIYEDYTAAEEAAFSFNGVVMVLIYAAAVLLNLMFRSENKHNRHNLALTSMGLGLFLFRFYSMILERIAFFYTPASNLLLADFMGVLKKEKRGVLMQIVVALLCMLLFIRRLPVVPWADYVFFWEVA